MNETLQNIRNRRSTRLFREDQITASELEAIIQAGLYAPSATNQQPWHFTVIQNKDLLDRLNTSFKEFAKNSDNEYAKRFASNEKFHVFYNAPTAIVVSANKNATLPQMDCAAATQNMLIAAESLDIGSCWIGFIGFLLNSPEGEEFVKELKIPEGFTTYHSIALGYKRLPSGKAPARKENTVTYLR